jgi:hypothetical protein
VAPLPGGQLASTVSVVEHEMPMRVSKRFIPSSSVFENCGPFAIVREETRNRLE